MQIFTSRSALSITPRLRTSAGPATMGPVRLPEQRREVEHARPHVQWAARNRPAFGSHRVVRRLSRDLHVVRMRLAKPSTGDAHKFRFRAKLVDRGATDVSHAAPKSTHHLEEHVTHWATIGYASLDPFWDQLLGRELALLEVS